VPLYRQGAVIGASYTRSDVVGNFGTFSSTGAGHTFGASYTMYLPPEGGRRSYVSLGLEDKVFDATVINDTVVGVDRRSRPESFTRPHRLTSRWATTQTSSPCGNRAQQRLASQNEDPEYRCHWRLCAAA
jgi:hypothetical protein